MIRFLTLLATLMGLVFGAQALACDIHGTSGIVEENDLYIGVDDKSNNTMTEEQFNAVLDKVEGIYGPIIESRSKELVIVRKWDDGTVNAYAQQSGNIWKISMFGGLARHETITVDAFALVACHELGHHLGGAPKKKSFWSVSWASNEGQSDFWGNLKCLRKYMEKDDNVTIVSKMDIDPTAKATCSKQFAEANDRAMCERGAMAGLSLGNLFRALRRLETELKFTTPDPGVVTRTNHSHPAPQCRLDTYFAGAICDKDHYSDTDDRDDTMGVCSRSREESVGVRPLCWFKPSAS